MRYRPAEIESEEPNASLSGRLFAATALSLAAAVGAILLWLEINPAAPPSAAAAVIAALPPSLPAIPAAAPPSLAPDDAAPVLAALEPAAGSAAPARIPPPLELAIVVTMPPLRAAPAPAAPAALPKPPSPATVEPPKPGPEAGLGERGARANPPRLGNEARKPWQIYARPFDRADRRPRVALLLSGLGDSGAATEAAIDDLPGGVTLAFDAYAPRLAEWIARARAAGHEVLLTLPIGAGRESRDGAPPRTLISDADSAPNIERLQWALDRVNGYVGVTGAGNARFARAPGELLPVLEELKRRGLMLVAGPAGDGGAALGAARSIGLPRAASDMMLDQPASRDAIDQSLDRLAALAKQNGAALGTGFIYPVTIERVAIWARQLRNSGIALAPASAVAEFQTSAVAGAGR